jgi:hypothetical protein
LTVKYRTRVVGLALGVATIAVLIAACGGSSNSNSGGGGNSGAGNGGAFQEYISCLSQNGVTIQVPSRGPGGFPSGGFPSGGLPSGARPTGFPSGGLPGGGGGAFQKPDGVDDATWQKAQTACASLRPSGGPGGGGNNGAIAAYRNCLSNHGVTMSAGPGSLNTTDPTVAAAAKACAALLPSTAPTG